MLDTYSAAAIDGFLSYAIEHDKLAIDQFKAVVREASQSVHPPDTNADKNVSTSDVLAHFESSLIRDCSYYEQLQI